MPTRAPSHRPARLRQPEGRESASARGYDSHWRKLRLVVLWERPVCEEPGCDTPATEVDHILAIEKGGTHERGNLRSLCKACHSRKTVMCDGGLGRRAM